MWCTNRLLWHTNSDFYGIRNRLLRQGGGGLQYIEKTFSEQLSEFRGILGAPLAPALIVTRLPKGSKRGFPNGVFESHSLASRLTNTPLEGSKMHDNTSVLEHLVPSALVRSDHPLSTPLWKTPFRKHRLLPSGPKPCESELSGKKNHKKGLHFRQNAQSISLQNLGWSLRTIIYGLENQKFYCKIIFTDRPKRPFKTSMGYLPAASSNKDIIASLSCFRRLWGVRRILKEELSLTWFWSRNFCLYTSVLACWPPKPSCNLWWFPTVPLENR